MECDREEAYRAKEIAEKKLMAGDMQESYKLAQKAYELYPALEGLSSMITAIEVHLAAHSKLYLGFMDWYSILQVSSSSDPSLIKNQYEKLALLLHPDKNKSVGAERAFKLITKARTVLSDKTRKASYDVKIKRQEGKSSPYKPNVTNLPPTPTTTTSISLKVNSTPTAIMPNSLNVSNSSDAQYPFTFTGTGETLEKTASVNSFPETPLYNDHIYDHGEDTPTPPNKSFNEQDSSIANTNLNVTNLQSSYGHNSSAASQLSTGKKPTFWTVCSSWQLLQECPQSQERQSIQCSDCRSQFVASEVATISVNDYTNGLSMRRKEENASVTEEYVMNGNEDNEPKQNFINHAADHSKKAKRGTKKGKGKSKKRRKLDLVPFKEDPDVKIVDPLSLHVRDADFHDFDLDRVEFCFEVQMSWLDRIDNSNKDLIKWANAGF
ncbi:hypothetical protein SUGI_1154490 [Cryptomeria japonica]|nr:hypothetical protein SUGI_1154490 [Cryptomeria japonica]